MTLAHAQHEGGDQTLWQWLPQFLRHELAPYPGRLSQVARMVVAATLSMIVIVTFRIPYGAIGVNCAFILSRENLTATAKSGFYFILAFAAWAVLTPIGARMFASVPITHFLWQAITIFICFFALKSVANFPLAAGIVVVATGTLAIWYLPGPAELNVELTLWQILATCIGALTTFLVEVVFRYFSREDPLLKGIDDRLKALEHMLRGYATDDASLMDEATMMQYALTGVGSLRQQVSRVHAASGRAATLDALLSLVDRSTELGAGCMSSHTAADDRSIHLAETLAERISQIRRFLQTDGMGATLVSGKASDLHSSKNLLDGLASVIGQMEQVLVIGWRAGAKHASRIENISSPNLFVKDAFENPDNLKYALAGTAAAMLCYIVYVGLDWPGISTAVTTCVLTALSTIGSSRQKQILRIVGASIGGFIFGLGSQVFVLPYVDSIVGLTLLTAFVTGLSAYVATSSPRLSYVGLQMAFAFYLINVTDFSISLDLTIGRDRAVGVLLGITAMWLVFDRLFPRPAAVQMIADLASAARLLASMPAPREALAGDPAQERLSSRRSQMANLLANVHAEVDAVSFESGRKRSDALAMRDRVQRWLSVMSTIHVLQLAFIEEVSGGDSWLRTHNTDVNRLRDAISAALEHVADMLEDQVPAKKHCASFEAGRWPMLKSLLTEEQLAKRLRGDENGELLLATAVHVASLEEDVLFGSEAAP